ncbi:MAG: putative lipid II flippase FtsW [Syntrophobacteraceae bacterium]|nr:putative lipid II flippase FtsW [Desulfobacteraceae bacterium]
MSRSIADTPAFPTDSDSRERQGTSRIALPLEMQLWIEVSLLIAFGLIMIYSASSVLPFKNFSDKAEIARSSIHYLSRQMICIALGVGTMMVLRRVPYQWFTYHSRWMLLAVFGALLLVLVPGLGAELNGARRWFSFKGFLLQPAEYAKVVWVLYLGVSLVKKQERINRARVSFWPHIFLCGILAGLLLKEPDFGTTFMIGCLTIVMLALGGVPLQNLFILVPIALGGFYKFVYMVPYRWERITAFLNPWEDRLDSGYQLIQAWIAVGSGGLLGKGLGAGQQKLFYLPEPYTDFILAVIGEELGFLGIVTVCALFLCFFRTGLQISRCAPDLLGTLFALGLTMMISLQALLNMGVVLGLVPTKGLPLPFISYGGSAFTANCVAVGILMGIARSGERRIKQNV